MPVGAIAGGALGAAGSIGAGLIQANSAQKALDFQKSVYSQNQQNLSPYIKFGTDAQASLSQLYGLGGQGAQGTNDAWNAFTQLPAYQFPLQQGMLALTRNLNAQGLNMSGAQAKEAQQYGQGLASQYLMSNYVNPLTQFAGMGSGAASSLAGTSANMANTIGNTQMAQGQNLASGVVGATNSINSVPGNLLLYSALARAPQGGQSNANAGFSSYQPLNILPSVSSGSFGGTGGVLGGYA